MNERARVVVIGGGIAGCSLAYHLTKLGWSDVTVIEKGELTSGSTWHAAGLCTQLNPSFNLTKLLMYSLDLYGSLEEETGQAVSLHRNGSLRLATTQDRLDEFRQRQSMAKVLGLEVELVGPDDVERLFPLLRPEGILAGAYLPTDGHVDPSSVTFALAAGARTGGATFRRHTAVLGIEPRAGEWLVRTTGGDIEAEIVVNAAGQWAREIGELVGVHLPIVPLQHQYLVTEGLPQLATPHTELPVLRDPDHSYYVREEGDGLIVGPFEPSPLTWALDGVPLDFDQQLLPPNLDQIEGVLEAAATRIPGLLDAGIRSIVNGPDGYTPDGRCLMGEVPGLRNFHVLAGFSIFGIVFGGGAGRYAAEWIVDGQPSDNMWELDVRRFGAYAEPKQYVAARACEVYEREYAIHYPHEELPAGRPLKTSPLYERLAGRGAVYGARFGWERPLWFAPEGVERADDHTFRRPSWLAHVAAECQGVRERVGVLDQTSFAKYELSGPGARALLDRLCANTLPAATGRISLTQMCTPRGGIECDVTVTMLADDRFYVVSAAATETHDLAWIEKHAPGDGSVLVDNVTSKVGVLTIAGPRSRELLQRISSADFSDQGFPFFRGRELSIGSVPVRALRLSYVGELGWELHHALDDQLELYELIVEAGRDLGLVDFGYRALEAMRLEKGYRLWGADMSADWTPFEAGLDRFVKLEKGEFIGRDALRAQRERGIDWQLSCLEVDHAATIPYTGEPVFDGDEIVAYVMSGGYGPTVGASIAFAYLPTALAHPGTGLAIELLGERVGATVVQAPLFDPENAKLRS
ncbi:MAG TPA: FAD-dependent oxidoreductase [Gaiellaceae bacterium]|nr:FAD-dependent oxidoreductase [Gaiellaceae bacterium]